ncbi:hypothetical protein CDAR_108231 [Caerostris darwini]|uniref:Uncharacterized protein n=1 Tax=Caerostris darwini TaxID=1538125 RepID=A0AAV4X164_9ARAC|nr:hypothetical protein CDAR_108231 [Caerostris darwini]
MDQLHAFHNWNEHKDDSLPYEWYKGWWIPPSSHESIMAIDTEAFSILNPIFWKSNELSAKPLNIGDAYNALIRSIDYIIYFIIAKKNFNRQKELESPVFKVISWDVLCSAARVRSSLQRVKQPPGGGHFKFCVWLVLEQKSEICKKLLIHLN